ncbi:ABC transporter permease [Elioraea sp. Yellowstone]|jgi:putative spermidine/putrescine transport system permease protein|uniref:ABC transporter permease n=1 Tax=Elioraea sp. Yellowstone TaxID=2592070 RepID=UPI0011529324|nr:ABC transporter permease [Elioraea sp. Yellowstone]TQF82534.1 ABC transporter permease [Elioraea sp. Yellowstone]
MTPRLLPWLLLAPALVALSLVFVLPIAWLFRISLNISEGSGAMVEAVALDSYATLFADDFTWALTANSFRLAATASTGAVLLGYPIALFLFRTRSRFRPLLAILAVAPLMVSGVARVVGWLVVLGDQGLVNAALIGLGLVERPVPLINNWDGVAIGLTESVMPYVILSLLAGFGRLDRSVEEAAATLGAPPWRVFLRITLPLSLPGVVLGWLIGFVLAMSAFVTPRLLGGGRVFVLATEIYDLALESVDWPAAAALAMYALALLLLVLAAYTALTRRIAH